MLHKRVTILVEEVQAKLKPVSLFLYGSRARGDAREGSDYEIGVLYNRNKKISRQELAELNQHKDINLYPFCYEDIKEQQVDTPFPPTIFLYELTSGGACTLRGERVIENLATPQITNLHIVARINFDVAMALAAMLTARAGDEEVSREHFYKSCLFGGRSLLIAEDQIFPLKYQDIHDKLLEKNVAEYEDVIRKALQARKGETTLTEVDFYKNIAFLTRFVRERLSPLMQDTQQIYLPKS